MKINLKNSFITSVDFVNQTAGNEANLKLQHKYSYNVKYAKDNLCRAELYCEVWAQGMEEKFHIKFTCVGIFAYDSSLSKEQVHIETYKNLFPVAQAFAVTLTANAGIPPVRIVPIDITSSNIYRIDLGGLNRNNEK